MQNYSHLLVGRFRVALSELPDSLCPVYVNKAYNVQKQQFASLSKTEIPLKWPFFDPSDRERNFWWHFLDNLRFLSIILNYLPNLTVIKFNFINFSFSFLEDRLNLLEIPGKSWRPDNTDPTRMNIWQKSRKWKMFHFDTIFIIFWK